MAVNVFRELIVNLCVLAIANDNAEINLENVYKLVDIYNQITS